VADPSCCDDVVWSRHSGFVGCSPLLTAKQLAARLSDGLADAGLTGDALRASEAAVALRELEPLSRQADG